MNRTPATCAPSPPAATRHLLERRAALRCREQPHRHVGLLRDCHGSTSTVTAPTVPSSSTAIEKSSRIDPSTAPEAR